jgi:hypothetical protein
VSTDSGRADKVSKRLPDVFRATLIYLVISRLFISTNYMLGRVTASQIA